MAPAKKNSKKTNTKKYAARREPFQRQASTENAGARVAYGMLFLLFGAVTAVSYFIQEGTLILNIRKCLSGVFGYGFWALAVCLIWVSIVIFQGRMHSGIRITSILLIPLLFSSFIDLLSFNSAEAVTDAQLLFERGQNFKCGGVLSGLLVNLMVGLLSKIGTGVVIFILLVVCVAMAVSEPREWYGASNGNRSRSGGKGRPAGNKNGGNGTLHNVKATASGVGTTLGMLWNGEGFSTERTKSFASSLIRMNDENEGDQIYDLRTDPRMDAGDDAPDMLDSDIDIASDTHPLRKTYTDSVPPIKDRSLFEGITGDEKIPALAPIRTSRSRKNVESQEKNGANRPNQPEREEPIQESIKGKEPALRKRTELSRDTNEPLTDAKPENCNGRSGNAMMSETENRSRGNKPLPASDEEYSFGESGIPDVAESRYMRGRSGIPAEREPEHVRGRSGIPAEREPEHMRGGNETFVEKEPEYAGGADEFPASAEREYRRPGTGIPARMTASSRSDIKDPEKITRKDTNKAARSIASQISKNAADPAVEYDFPPTVLLNLPKPAGQDSDREIHENRIRLENALHSFGVNSSVVRTTHGPTVTRYDIELEQGVKLTKVTNLSNDLALSLGVSSVRIAPIPDEISTVGIEVPNKIINTVSLREILESEEFVSAKSRLSFAIGKDIGGRAIVGNISKLPHMLIAGTTGSGKSVCMNSLIISLLYKSRPEEVKLIMIDPKMVELGIYNSIPHLYVPVVTEPKKAAGALQWSVVEMLKRYRLFSEVGMRDLQGYNQYCRNNGEQPLPQVVIVIDELADLMMAASKEVEESICRIAQMGRAAGMHLIIATQRPSADVITGLMKANIPSRIAFAVSSALESRIILDQGGADKLIGMGDMLYAPIGCGKPLRVQGAFVSDEEREKIIKFISSHSTFTPAANEELTQFMDKAMEGKNSGDGSGASGSGDGRKNGGGQIAEGYDEMLPDAVEVVLEMKSCSVSMLQRRIKLGYSRAARIVDQMEELGIVGPYEGAKPRSVPITREDWNFIKAEKLGLSTDDDFALAAEINEMD